MGILAVTIEEALITYGPLGIGVFVLGLFSWRMVTWLFARVDKAEAQRDAMVQEVLTSVMPAVNRATEVLDKRQNLDREILDAMIRGKDVLERLEAELYSQPRRVPRRRSE